MDLLGFFPHMNSADGYYPATDYDNMPITSAKLLNVSNSAGVNNSSRVRQLDTFIEHNDLVACTAQSGTEIGNRTTSGNAYNSIVVDQYYSDVENFDGAELNDHGAPRYKPDLMARSGSSAATSYSAPTVCSAAAVLLERASVDAAVANAANSVVVKAILMAGATRFNYRLSVEWSDVQEIADPPVLRAQPLFYHGEWQRTSDALPTSPQYGAGHLNILAAYDILDANEFDAGGTEAVGSRGWDYADGLAEEDVNTYSITIAQESMFSAVLVWHRYIDDAFVSYLPDYAVSVYDSDETRVAHSDSLTSNVELVEVRLPAGTYRLETRLVVGFLENPGPDSFQSGIGVVSGWVCTAEVAEIALNGAVQEAAYGTARSDTAGVCGDTDNGFGLLFNWNLVGDGEHEVVAYVDGVELTRTAVTVTTLGAEFVRDVTGECSVADFPSAGETVSLVWQQAQQNFVLTEGSAPTGASQSGMAGVGSLENPSPNSFQSGIGVLSGWVCTAEEVVITIGDLAPQVAGYGTERLDTLDVCGDTDNGFGLLFNWNLLGDGDHEVIAYVDNLELGRTTVRVTTLGEEFVRGAVGECTVADFPSPGEAVTLTWQQTSQNFVDQQGGVAPFVRGQAHPSPLGHSSRAM